MSELWPDIGYFIFWQPDTRKEIQWVIAHTDRDYQKRRREDIIRRARTGESGKSIAKSWNISYQRVRHLIVKYEKQL